MGFAHIHNKALAKQVTGFMLALGVLTTTACVSNVSSQIREENRDNTGTFDGSWTAEVQKSAGRQIMPGNWLANCNGEPWTFNLNVNKGVAKTNLRFAKETTFVAGNGDFRFDIPLENKATASPGAVRQLGLTDRTMIVYGNLKKAKGRVTFGVAEFGNSGCTAVIKFAAKGGGAA